MIFDLSTIEVEQVVIEIVIDETYANIILPMVQGCNLPDVDVRPSNMLLKEVDVTVQDGVHADANFINVVFHYFGIKSQFVGIRYDVDEIISHVISIRTVVKYIEIDIDCIGIAALVIYFCALTVGVVKIRYIRRSSNNEKGMKYYSRKSSNDGEMKCYFHNIKVTKRNNLISHNAPGYRGR